MALAHTSNTLAMNFLCGTRTFWLFGLPKVTECGQGDFISLGNGEFGPRVVVFCLLSSTAPKGKPERRPLFGSALSAPAGKTGVGQFAPAPYTRTARDSWSVKSEGEMPLNASGQMNSQMNTVIVDDEKPARDELAFLLKSFPEVSLVGQGKNGLEAVALIKEHNPDLVFLDVQMPGLDGFGVIQRLMDRKVRLPHIVFATAYESYAVQAFEVNAVDYILKPFDKQRLARAVQRARRILGAEHSPAERLETLVNQLGNRSDQPVKLLVKSQGRLLLVDAEDMVCASIEDGTITICTRELEGTSNYRTIEDLAEGLDSERFWRAHRSHLVNIDHIKEVLPWFKSSYMLKMADKRQSEVPVSRAQTKRLRELLKM